MPLFQVSARSVQPSGLPNKRPRRVQRWWYYVLLRLTIGALIITVLATLLSRVRLIALFFILLPVIVTFIHALFSRYNRNKLLLTIGLAFISTLREEIDLDQLRERLFTLIQITMQPQSVSLWARKAVQNDVGRLPTQSEWGENVWHTRSKEPRREIQASRTGTFYAIELSEINIADNDPLLAYALSSPGAIEIERTQLDSPALTILKTSEVEFTLPLANQGELIGLLNLGPRLSGQKYASQERRLLHTLAAQVAPALRVAQMVYEQQIQVRERERMEQELQTAQAIQRTFLPKEVPLLSGWQLVPYYQPAREVGGDFYDFLPFEDGRMGLVIGDVTDKGVPAALVMATTHTMLRTAAQEQASPG